MVIMPTSTAMTAKASSMFLNTSKLPVVATRAASRNSWAVCTSTPGARSATASDMAAATPSGSAPSASVTATALA